MPEENAHQRPDDPTTAPQPAEAAAGGPPAEPGGPGSVTRPPGGRSAIHAMGAVTIAAVAFLVFSCLWTPESGTAAAAWLWALRIAAGVLAVVMVILVLARETSDMRRARGLIDERDEINRRLGALSAAGQQIGSTLDLNDVLEELLDHAFAESHADMGALHLLDRPSGALKVALVRGVEEQKVIFKEFPMETGLVGEAAGSRRLIAVGDMTKVDERDNAFYGAATPGSQVVVPLAARDKFVGVMVLGTAEKHRYGDEELRRLEGLAEIGGLAISNAELYRIARRSLDVAAQRRGYTESVLGQMVAGVMTADMNGRIAVFNKEAQRLTGYTFTEKTQMLLRPELSIDENPLGPLEQQMLEVLARPTSVREGEALIMKSDKTLLPISYRIYPLSDGDKTLGVAAVFMEAVSGEKEPQRREGVDYQVLLRSLGARIERLYTHPLSRVLDRVRSMDIDSWSMSRGDIVRILEAGSLALLSLLEDVEQYLSCVTIREWDSREEEDLSAIAAEVVSEVLKAPDSEGVVVKLALSGLPPAFGYERMMKAALHGVIENAVTAAAAGGKKVEITGRSSDGYLRVEVADTGPGIPPEARQFMFMPFYTTSEGRSGLGLPIVHRVMQRLGGRVGVEGRAKGALVFLEFPVSPRPSETAPGGTSC